MELTFELQSKLDWYKLLQGAIKGFIEHRPDCGFSAQYDGFEWRRNEENAKNSKIRFYLAEPEKYSSTLKEAAIECDACLTAYGTDMELRLDMKTMPLEAIEKQFGHTDAMTLPGNKFTAVVFLYAQSEPITVIFQKALHELAHIYTKNKMKALGFDITQYNDPQWAKKHQEKAEQDDAVCAAIGSCMWLEFIAEYIAFDTMNCILRSDNIPDVRSDMIRHSIQENIMSLMNTPLDYVFHPQEALRTVSYAFAAVAGLFFSAEGAYDVLVDEYTIDWEIGRPKRRKPVYNFGFSKRTAAGKELYRTIINLLETLYSQFVSKEDAYEKYNNDENLFYADPVYHSEQYVLDYDTAVDIGMCIYNICGPLDELADS